MVNVRRVLLDDDALKVSKAGQDVLTAPPLQLNFNSDWSGMGVHMIGSHNWSWDGSAANLTEHAEYTFGKTFLAPPFVICQRSANGGWQDIGSVTGVRRAAHLYVNDPNPILVASMRIDIDCLTDRIVFDGTCQRNLVSYPGIPLPQPGLIRFMILNYTP